MSEGNSYEYSFYWFSSTHIRSKLDMYSLVQTPLSVVNLVELFIRCDCVVVKV